jgi:hypothetical protein
VRNPFRREGEVTGETKENLTGEFGIPFLHEKTNKGGRIRIE